MGALPPYYFHTIWHLLGRLLGVNFSYLVQVPGSLFGPVRHCFGVRSGRWNRCLVRESARFHAQLGAMAQLVAHLLCKQGKYASD
jgi:hypothetical protein